MSVGDERHPEYGVGPRSYLARARQRLGDGTPESLFYAAFELRCFVEARQDEYLDAQKQYARSLPRAFQIGAQHKALKGIFESDRIQHLAWRMEDGFVFDAYHVPVSVELKNRGERLGELLHAQEKWRAPDDPWWDKTRRDVLDTYRLAWRCSKGQLTSPAFLIDGKTIGNVILDMSGEDAKRAADVMKVGARVVIEVAYLGEPPAAWVCDI